MTVSPSRTAKLVGVWLLVAVFFATQGVLVRVSRGGAIDWQWDVFHEFVYCLVWAAFTPIILRMADRWPLDRESLRRVLPRHLAAMLPVAVLQVAVTYFTHGSILVAVGVLPRAQFPTWFTRVATSGVVWGAFTGSLYYWTIAAIYWAAAFQRMYRAQKLAAARLEASLAAARLDALRAQLQPHFLFNTLNAISVLTEDDAGKAKRMLLRLSDLLRLTLEGGSHEVPLRQELELLDGYLDIERVRFEERLRVEIAVAPEVLGAMVPTLLLQPLVENAVRHGVDPHVGGGTITVRARREGEWLALEVRDNGRGLAQPESRPRNGVGLANTRARLAELYGPRHRLELSTPAEGGVAVAIHLPFREA